MRVIDTNTGTELREGLVFKNVLGWLKVLEIRPGFWKASARIQVLEPNRTVLALQSDGTTVEQEVEPFHQPGQVIETPLLVRYLHPSFLFQRVAFLPS